ncbi:uncharacterized protein LOC125315841 [Rhodamnia argentea]|uniref:Uncharacterized protein LOC125315841 n=1 Tax=Rhodamnia argentea TaxID=178133 RepID=A0ABM3HMF8_9MYRT|nr:uncharacterized protein LOC125315841 [Rhodamnia argentea]
MINALSSMDICQAFLPAFVLFLAMTTSVEPSNRRSASSCGDIGNISHLFSLKSNPNRWGIDGFDLTCEDNRTVWYFSDNRLYVQSIDYTARRIRLVDDGLQKDNCLSLPHNSLLGYGFNSVDNNGSTLVIMNCSKPVSSPFYIATGPCIEGSYSSRSNTSLNWNLHALLNPKASDVRDFCNISRWTWTDHFAVGQRINSSSYNNELIHSIMTDGFVFSYVNWKNTFFCYFDFYSYFHLRKIFFSFRFSMSSINGGQVCGYKYYWGGKYCFLLRIQVL